ncbi:GntR family transcriptional regulator [Streptosporangium sp. NPDC051022]|uniref:GntR family transcriptional regulator n=1 Tax=Streptosporangium sp. NPDC051022 TaxID=3155752 RepID=UPI00343F9249
MLRDDVVTAPDETTETTVSRSDLVYTTLRDQIIHGVLRPNEALVELDLAERLQVSRTPVRDALRRLADDGMIIVRRRRWVVREHTREEIIELYELRAALESHAARLAAVRATDQEVTAMRDFQQPATTFKDTANEVIARQWVDANGRFHGLVNRASRSSQIYHALEKNWLYHFNFRVAAMYSPEDRETSTRQHVELIEAISGRDPERAGAVAREHVEFSLALLLRLSPNLARSGAR